MGRKEYNQVEKERKLIEKCDCGIADRSVDDYNAKQAQAKSEAEVQVL